MAGVLRHRKVSTKPEATDSTKILASDWGSSNTDYATAPSHVLAGGSHGALLWYDTSAIDNANWLPGVASGAVLVSGGVNQPASWSASPTLTSLTLGVPLSPANGGTGFASYAVGDLLYASGSATLARLADVAAGSVMASGGVGVAPLWSATPSLTSLTLSTPLSAPSGGTGFGSFAVGDILYASATNALSKLADVAVGSVMVSGGVNTAPAWSATPTLTSVGFSGGSVFNGAATNVVEQRNSTSAQTFRVYNTFTDASNYERAVVGYSGNTLFIGTQKAGTGSARSIFFGTNPQGVPDAALSIQGTVVDFYPANLLAWRMSGSGHLITPTDNTYDIGATNTTRPRNAHLAGYMAIGDGITAPGAGTGEARIYVDTADGDLKVVYADGVVKTIVVDT